MPVTELRTTIRKTDEPEPVELPEIERERGSAGR